MKGSVLAPYSCAFQEEFPELVQGFRSYSKANCELSAIQKVYNEWFSCNSPSMPIIDGKSIPNILTVSYATNQYRYYMNINGK